VVKSIDTTLCYEVDAMHKYYVRADNVSEYQETDSKLQGEDVARRIAEIKGRIHRFYIAWNILDRGILDVGALAAAHVHSLDVLNSRLRDKYHGTDLTWTPERIGQLVESLEGARIPLPHASPMRTVPMRTASPSPRQDEAHERAQEAVEELVTALATFYNAWQIAKDEDDVKTLARDYVHKQHLLAAKLQAEFYGTDMSWPRTPLAARIEHVRRDEEGRQASLLLRKKSHELAKALQLATTKMKAFYAAWGFPRNAQEFASLASQYVAAPADFDAALRLKYHGTDSSWQVDDIAAMAETIRQREDADKLQVLLLKLVCRSVLQCVAVCCSVLMPMRCRVCSTNWCPFTLFGRRS